MDKETAILIKEQALEAIVALSRIAKHCSLKTDSTSKKDIHRSAAIIIGKVQMDILEPIYITYPELDDISQDNS